MALLDKDSCPCVNSEIDFFNVPPTNTSSTKSFYTEVYPTNALDQGGPIEFSLAGNKQDFIDLLESFISLKCKVLKEDNSSPAAPAQANDAIPDASLVFPVNYLNGALFKDVITYLNGKQISGCNDMYPYKSFLELILSYEKPILEETGAIGLFHKDTKDFNEVANIDATHNAGAKARFDKTKYGKTFEIFGKIHNDLFAQGKRLPGDIPLVIKFIKNTEKFMLMAKEENTKYKIRIDNAILHVKRFTVSSALLRELDIARDEGRFMKYPMKRVVMKYTTQSPNQAVLQELNLISNEELPQRIFMALLDSRSFDGHHHYNPFYFKHFDAQNIVLKKGEDKTPFNELKLKFDNDEYSEAYISLLHGTGRLFQNEAISITPIEYKNGMTIYCFDLSKNGHDGDTFELNEIGTIHVIVRLKAAVNHAITMVFYLEYNSLLAIGPSNQTKVTGGK